MTTRKHRSGETLITTITIKKIWDPDLPIHTFLLVSMNPKFYFLADYNHAVITVGRTGVLQLEDRYVSRRQCAMHRDEAGRLKLVHSHGAKHPTLVNGVPIDRILLRPGHLIRMAMTELLALGPYDPKDSLPIPASHRDRFVALAFAIYGGNLSQVSRALEIPRDTCRRILQRDPVGTALLKSRTTLHESVQRFAAIPEYIDDTRPARPARPQAAADAQPATPQPMNHDERHATTATLPKDTES